MRKLIIAIVTFLALDVLWLGLVAKYFYQNNLRNFLNISQNQLLVNWPSALIVYVLLIGGILLFPVTQAKNSTYKSFILGFGFGLCVYGTYGFTNHALVKNWPFIVTIVDTI